MKSPGRSLSQSSQVQTVKHSSTVEAANRDSPLRSRTSPGCKVTERTPEEERMEGLEPPSTSNDSNTLQMREDFQRDIAEIEKQIHGQPRRRSQRLRTQGECGSIGLVCTVLYIRICTCMAMHCGTYAPTYVYTYLCLWIRICACSCATYTYIPQGHTVILYLTACTVRCNLFKTLYFVFFQLQKASVLRYVRTYAHVNPSVSLHVCLCAFSSGFSVYGYYHTVPVRTSLTWLCVL